jgi:integrase
MSFFKWAQAEFKLHGNPVVPIRSPRLRDVERELFSAEDVVRIVAAQPELRDRVALKLLFLMGLRKGELAAIRYRDFDSAAGACAFTARAARSGTRRFRPRSSVRSSPSSRSGATRRSTSFTRRSAARRER